MAIRINAGAIPKVGRLTMPKGTFLPEDPPFSNPATSAIGSIAGASGMNPPPGMVSPFGGTVPQYGYQSPEQGQPNFLGNLLSSINQQMKQSPNMLEMANQFSRVDAEKTYGAGLANVLQGYTDIVKGLGNAKSDPTGAFTPPKNATNSLVGANLAQVPNFVSEKQLMGIYGQSNSEVVAQTMNAKGYVRSYQPGVGAVWIKAGEGQPGAPNFSSATSGSVDERGRPEFVDPTALEYGERVTAQSGLTFVGGIPYTNPAGETVSQYAMTIPGGQSDEHFKWKSTIKKDDSGNWVNVYSRELRAVYTRSHWKRKAAREEQAQMNAKPKGLNNAEVNQLVNLRASYG